MAYEKPKPLSIKIFPNKYKKKDKHPDYRGTIIDANGKEWDASLWKIHFKNQEGFFIAGQISDAEENKRKYAKKKQDDKAASQPASPPPNNDADDLPF